MAASASILSPEDYRIACICPMAKEFAAMRGMLDADHTDLPMPNSRNAYAFGEIGSHNVVIAIMPSIGNNRSAAIANQLLNDFPTIDLALLVGIGGGIPTEKIDIRLGDVVVGKKSSAYGAVVQFDLVKLASGIDIRPTSGFGLSSTYYMNRVELLDAKHRNEGADISQHISRMLKKYPKMHKQHYGRPEGIGDLLFPAKVLHTGGATCDGCDTTKVVKRSERPDQEPEIHYGTIASGAFVLKDAALRDRLGKELGAYCIEMEAAGTSQDLNCLVVRGISDYADNHKHDGWQQYAAATAAAYAKELLLSINPTNINTNSDDQNNAPLSLQIGPNLLPFDRLGLTPSPVASDDSRDDLPFSDSDDFIGRKGELDTMWTVLQPQTHSSQHKVLALRGRPGVGKARLVAEHARIHAVDYSSVFWLNATTEDDLRASLLSTYQHVLKDVPRRDSRANTQTVFAQFDSWLSKHHGDQWLIVYKNYDDPSLFDIEQYYPQKSHGCIIITSHSLELKQRNQLHISAFKVDDDTLALLQRTSGRNDIHKDQRVSELFDVIQGSPIAISMVGAFLKHSNFTCGQYLRALSNTHSNLKISSGHAAQYPQRVLYPICNLSLKLVEQSNFRATKLLKLLAYFDNRDVWFDLIAAGKSSPKRDKPGWYIELANHWIQFDRIMRLLNDFQFVQVNSQKGSYSVHSLIHGWALSLQDDTTDETFFRIVFECVANVEKISTGHASGRGSESRILRHAVRLSGPLFSTHLHEQDCYYISNIAFVLGKSYHFSAAARLYEVALSRFSNDFAKRANVSLLTMSNLAIQYDNTDRVHDAIWLLSKALAVYENLRNTDTTDMIRVTHCLAWMSLKQGDFVRAQATCERAQQRCEKYLPRHHEGKFFKAAKVRQSTLRGALHSTTIGIVSAVCSIFNDQAHLSQIAVMIEDMIAQAVHGAELSGNGAVLARNVLPLATKTLLELCRGQAEKRDSAVLLMYLMRLMHIIELTESSDSNSWETLAEALFLNDDVAHARVARDFYLLYEYGVSSTRINCNVCGRKNLNHKTGRLICAKCRDVDFCSECAGKYQTGFKVLETCHNHQLIDRLKNCTPKPDEARLGMEVREKPWAWLKGLRHEYVAQLEALDSARKRSLHLIRPDVEKVWPVARSRDSRE